MNEQERFRRYFEQTRTALAHRMVRLFFEDAIVRGGGTEAQFVAAYLTLADRYPEMGMEEVGLRLRRGYLTWRERRDREGQAQPIIVDLEGS